jgi:YHS domain-containing protein
MLWKFAAFLILPAVLAATVVGCGEGTNPAKGTSSDSAAKGDATDDLPGLKDLNEADRKLAETQKFCPVSGNRIGTSGMTPCKITVKGRTFFLCCDGCKDEVENHPDKYLKKLDALTAKK